MFYFTVSQEWPKRADKASLLTASGMQLHVFPSMFVSSLREFLETVFTNMADICFIEYLHRKLLKFCQFSLL